MHLKKADTKVTEYQRLMYLYVGQHSIYVNNAWTIYSKRKIIYQRCQKKMQKLWKAIA